MFNIHDKIDSTVISEKVLLPSAGGFLIALLVMPLFGINQLDSALGVLVGLNIGALVGWGVQFYRGEAAMGEFEKRMSEKSGLISFAILLTLLSANIVWKISTNQPYDQNILYIAIGTSLIYTAFRVKEFWPGNQEMVEQIEEIKEEEK